MLFRSLIEALPQAPAVRDAFGGSPYLIYRDDRFTCLSGADQLQGVKLKQDAPHHQVRRHLLQ